MLDTRHNLILFGIKGKSLPRAGRMEVSMRSCAKPKAERFNPESDQ